MASKINLDRARLMRALTIIDDLLDVHPCELDHNGACQAHGWFEDDECPQARARRFLAETLVSEVTDG